MLISAAPVAIPVSTANPPTEAVAVEAAKKTPIPEPKSTTENTTSRNSTEANEQPKTPITNNREAQQGGQSDDSAEQKGQQDNEQAKQQQREKRQDSEQAQQVQQLKNVDREVRAHETAHASVGGRLAGSPQLSFTTGPDGKRYAVAGEVSIDTGKVPNNPQATIDKMKQVRQAALAPANPSPQDLKVAALANKVANQALIELNVQRNQEQASRRTQGSSEASGSEQNGDQFEREIRFSNPVAARRSSLQLNQKIVDSGALDDIEQRPLLSQIA